MKDPTYVQSEIQARPAWALAFRLSEWDNDNAPIGWSAYLPEAQTLLSHFGRAPVPDDAIQRALSVRRTR